MHRFKKKPISFFIWEASNRRLQGKKLLAKTFFVVAFFALMGTVVLVPTVNAMTLHPSIVNCTQDQDGITTTVGVPSGTETWRCTKYNKVFYYNGTSYLLSTAGWALVNASPNPSPWENFQSNLFMTVLGASHTNGAPIIQYPGVSGQNAVWNMQGSKTPGYMKVGSANTTNTCMGVEGGSIAQGARVIQWTCNGNGDQAWLWVWNGFYSSGGWPVWNIVNNKSSLCLGIDNGSTASNAYVIQWNCNANNDQNWF